MLEHYDILNKRYDNFLEEFNKKHNIDNTSSYETLHDIKIQEAFFRELEKFNEDPSAWDRE